MEAVQLKPTGEVEDINLEDLDDILSKLTAEEIEELNGDFDPDNSMLPPSERMKNQTDKTATGKFNRQALLAWLEKKAKEEKDWEQNKAYVKEIKGKVWKPKEQPKQQVHEDESVDTEWDEILTAATEEELVDLAAVLGFHGMLNQTQYYASLEDRKVHAGGFQVGVAQAQELKPIPLEPPNPTNVEESLEKLKNNDKDLKHLNLNNIKNISHERLIEFVECLKTNTVLTTLEMASVAMTDKVACKFPEALRANKSLKSLNLESNFISGDALVKILEAINVNQSLTELRFANQKPETLGNKIEMKIVKLVEANDTLLKFGIAFEFPETRNRVTDKIQENNDNIRKKRIGAAES